MISLYVIDATPVESNPSLSSGGSSSSIALSSLSLVPSNSGSSLIHERACELAGAVQCVVVMETPTPQPMRLVVMTVIHKILLSLFNAVSHLEDFYHTPLKPREAEGFK